MGWVIIGTGIGIPFRMGSTTSGEVDVDELTADNVDITADDTTITADRGPEDE